MEPCRSGSGGSNRSQHETVSRCGHFGMVDCGPRGQDWGQILSLTDDAHNHDEEGIYHKGIRGQG